MSIGDQAKNKAQEFEGKAKGAVGDLTGDRSLQAEGKADEAAANAKQFGEKAKGAASDAKDAASDAVHDAKGAAQDAAHDVKNAAQDAAHDVKNAAQDVVDDVTKAARKGHGVINRLSRAGFRSEYAYIAGFASVGVSLASWLISRNKTGDDKAQSDRWGIFIGHWAPTFMALGVALKLEED